MSKIVVTGASGFIGCSLCDFLSYKHDIVRLSQTKNTASYTNVDYSNIGAMSDILSGADIVIHLADNANRNADQDRHSLERPKALIHAMQRTGVSKLIYTSSVYARIFKETGRSAYGSHKLHVEKFFQSHKNIDSIILRLPPVYGPNGKGGFSILAKALRRHFPLPISSAYAKRSYISRNNLTDLIECLIEMTPKQWAQLSGQIFEPSDAMPISTKELAIFMKQILDSKSFFLPFPVSIMQSIGKVIGKSDMVEGVFGELLLNDDPKFRKITGWSPKEAMPESLEFLRKY